MPLFSLLRRAIHNRVLLQLTRGARRAVKKRLTTLGFTPRSTEVSLGFAEPSKLRMVVVFPNDSVLDMFDSSHAQDAIQDLFRKELLRSGYPADAARKTTVSFHSHETINRSGGYHLYFS